MRKALTPLQDGYVVVQEMLASRFTAEIFPTAPITTLLPGSERQPRPKTTSASPLILLVEDDFILRGALTETLCDEGYQVECAANGVEGLRRVLQPPRPALVLLDIMMPHMDGLTFRSTQLALPVIADIPVIVISAAGPGRGAAGLRFARMFTKPIDTSGLLDSIREVLETPPKI
jgi:CheY-like chemotaxis protein